MKELDEEQLKYIKELLLKNTNLELLGFGTQENKDSQEVYTALIVFPIKRDAFNGTWHMERFCSNPDGVYLSNKNRTKRETALLENKTFTMTPQLRSIFASPLKSRTLIL